MTPSASMLLFAVLLISATLLTEAQQSQPVAGQTAFDEIVVESTLFVKGKTGTGRQGKASTLESAPTESGTVDRPKRASWPSLQAKTSAERVYTSAHNTPLVRSNMPLGVAEATHSNSHSVGHEGAASSHTNSLRDLY